MTSLLLSATGTVVSVLIGAAAIALVGFSVGYSIWRRRHGKGCCGCDGCSCACHCSAREKDGAKRRDDKTQKQDEDGTAS